MLFSDDTVAIFRGKTIETLIQNVNFDLNEISIWLNCTKLKYNANKTVYLVIGKKNKLNTDIELKIGNDKIERVSHIKYLGIIVDDKLNFDKEIESVSKKIASKVNFLSRINKKLTVNIKKIA